METDTLKTPESPDFGAGTPPPPEPLPAPGFGPTPDPTRSGALWVGGAGVVLLLAAAAVLTAVRWDEIGQSVKLGGLVTITLALLGAGQRFKNTIPMTAQAIFHLGALLIPFDMAAVAILAGRSWQETLLLTSVTSVIAWYGIERGAPSKVLLWCAGGAVIALAAGIAAVSAIAMSLSLAAASVIAIASLRPRAAGIWAATAGVLPTLAFVPWPARIAGAMADLGFDSADRWQPLATGLIATAVLVATTRLLPRVEIAWAAMSIAAVTAIVSFGGFDSHVNIVSMAAAFVGIELLALATRRDVLWQPIAAVVAVGGEILTVGALAVLAAVSVGLDDLAVSLAPSTMATACGLLGLGWLIADARRLRIASDWLTGFLFGSDWPPTTLMFPAAMLCIAPVLEAPAFVTALVALALGYWMVATWRVGGTYGAIALVTLAATAVAGAHYWTEFGVGAAGAALLMLAAQLRVRSNDLVGSTCASIAGVFVWLITGSAAFTAFATGWPIVLVAVGAWALSWIVEARRVQRSLHPVDWLGRLTAVVLTTTSLWTNPTVGIALCLSVVALAVVDYVLAERRGTSDTNTLLLAYSTAAGVALGLIGVPIAALIGLSTAWAGAAVVLGGFVLVGMALTMPRPFDTVLGSAATVASIVGLAMSFGEAGSFALALIGVGCSTIFMGAALRDLVPVAFGYIGVALGVALQLAVWRVDWLEPYLALPALAVLYIGYRFQRSGTNSWAAYAPTIALMAYVSIADRIAGGSAWHAVIAGTIGVLAVIGGGYRRLVGPLVTGSAVLAVVVGYESLGPAALVPTWAWLAVGGTVLLAAGVAMERSDTTPLERGQQLRSVISTEFS